MTRRWFGAIIVLLIVVAVGCFLFIKFNSATTKDAGTNSGVLTVADLDKPEVKVNSETSDASVNNLIKELTAKINKQIAAKENPFESVSQLVDVLADTTNTTRQDQLRSFVVDFLGTHEDALWFTVDSEKPDQAQVNYWKAILYAKLVYNYQYMMGNQYTGPDGKPVDTTREQLTYIDLYLALAHDSASQSRSTDEYKRAPLAYTYSDVDNFVKMRNELARK